MKLSTSRFTSSIAIICLLATTFILPHQVQAQIQPVSWIHLSSAFGDLPVPPSSDGQVGLRVVDLDKDGQNDYVITLWKGEQTVVWYRRSGDTFEKFVIDTETPNLSHGEQLRDIDGDGDIDLLFGDASKGNKIYWWENPYPNYDSNTPWVRRIVRDTGENFYHDNIWGDFDGDGEEELIAWNQYGQQLLLFDIPPDPKNSGSWPVVPIYSWEGNFFKYRGTDAVDINLDGKIDFVGGCGWFEHQSGTDFVFHQIDSNMEYSQIKAGQLIPGGRPEIVCVLELSEGPLNMYEWNGSEWETITLLPSIPRSHTLQLGDVNLDGHLDIMLGAMGLWGPLYNPPDNPNAGITVLYGDSTGNFVQQTVSQGLGDLEGQLADIDNDGDLDIMAKPFRDQAPRMDIYLNQGGATPAVVPTLVGKSQAEAEADILAAGFSIGMVTTINSDTVATGNVAIQKPVAGFSAIINWPVDLLISSGPASIAYTQDFENYETNDDPFDWLDTGQKNSMSEDDSLFKVSASGINKVFGTSSTATNIHSHYLGTGIDTLPGYEYTGRMMFTDPTSGIGLTMFSQYNSTDAYYRLRRYENDRSLHFDPHGTSIHGNTNTGVIPIENIWYRFKIQVEDTGSQTELRAKVWPEAEIEPFNWLANGYDASALRLTQGTIGLWSMGIAAKNWDDLSIYPLTSTTELVTVPNIVGLLKPDAENALLAAFLVVGSEATASSDTVPVDSIISQSPSAGISVLMGSPVSFVVSSGPVQSVTVPDLQGLTQTEADQTLTSAELILGTVTSTNSDTVPVGTIISQEPTAGTSVASGTTVNIELSSGPVQMVTVPDLLGLSSDDAESTLTAAGLILGTTTVTNNDTVPAETVLSQDPVAGTLVENGTAINLVISQPSSAYDLDFEEYPDGADPENWLDTDANNSMVENDNLFKVVDTGGGKVFSTSSTTTNIHSHYVGGAIDNPPGYEFSGRMMITDAGAGIGVTFFSYYPYMDAYYRLRRYNGGGSAFHISAHGTNVSGDTTTGIIPNANLWYRFKIQVEDTTIQTEIRAKVWLEGTNEPLDWQVDASDASANRLTGGTIGIWSMGGGTKHWDDFTVYQLDASSETIIAPDVVGFVQATAEQTILNAGLLVGTITNTNSDTVPTGDVISQDPTAGTPVNSGTAVNLLVSLGPVQTVPVPNVTGFVQAAAEQTILDAGLLVGTITITNSDTVPTGDVISQDPTAGTPVNSGTAVNLLVSLGPVQTVTVPNVIGLVQAAAEQTILDAGLLIGTITTTSSDTVPSGEVISQNPVAESFVNSGTTVDLVVSIGTAAYLIDFESYSDGQNPSDWKDTAAKNSLVENDSLFQVVDTGAEKFFATSSSATNIHSHYLGTGVDTLPGYEYSGRMRITNSGSGIGVTFFSAYPSTDTYYRLRRYKSGSNSAFHLSSHGTTVTGNTSTGVIPAVNQWYRFKIHVHDTGTQTDIQAKVWVEGDTEPLTWQLTASDASATRLTTGTIGVWSMGSGAKHWDDLNISSLE